MDGGYYAIKGFEFQIDKTILELFEADNESKSINLEQIQDINTSDYVMQVKYKETQTYSPSKIREPLIQLIEEFQNNKTSNYFLYCHFSDKIEQKTSLSSAELDEVLKISIKPNSSKKLKATKVKADSFTVDQKKDFLKKFNIVFAPSFQTQFEAVISEIKNLSFCNTDDEAVFYYSNITDFLRKLVVKNPIVKNRKCTRKEILNYIKGGRKMVFTSSFIEYKGELEYLKYLKSNFIKPIKNQENFIFIGNITEVKELSIGQLIISLIVKQYDKASYDVKPITFIVPDDKTIDIKKDLLDSKIFFNDGYESIQFCPDLFFMPPIINRKIYSHKATESLGKTSFKLRLISKTTFEKNYNAEINPNRTYYFSDELNEKLKENSFIKIDKIGTKQLQNLFNT
jgi:hypothetical protein